MLSTHLTQFLKNLFELLEKRNVHLEKNDENIVSHVVGFVMNVFKNAESSVGSMRMSDAFRTSLVKDLRVICDDISKFIAHLNAETKLIDTQGDFKIYNSNEHVVGKCGAQDVGTNDSTQIDDYYWDCEDFLPSNVVHEPDTRHTYFEEPLWSELEKIQHIVNDTKHGKTQRTSNQGAANKSKVANLEASKKEKEKDVKTVKSLSIPNTCSQNLASKKSSISHDQLRFCTINHISVRNINSLNDLNAKDGLQDTRYISILYLDNLAVINASFAIDTTKLHSIIRQTTGYKCLLCSVYMEPATVENLIGHIQSSSHMDKLAKEIIWVSSLVICVGTTVSIHLYKCCLCLTTDDIAGLNEHFKSVAHKQSSSTATTLCSSTLEAMENAVENKEMNAQMLTSNFQAVLGQHKIKILNKQLSCDTCSGTVIPMSLYNLYTHITGQKHWRPYFLQLKKGFAQMPLIRNHVDETYRGFMKVYNGKEKSYCQICNIFIDGVSTKTMNLHIKSYAHNQFLMLYLKNTKFCAFIDLNEGSEEEGRELGLPGASHSKPKANASQKTEIIEAGSHIILDYNIAIEKYSWNGMMIANVRTQCFWCVPCDMQVRWKNGTKHIAEDRHKATLSSWRVDSKQLMRKSENDDSVFCLACGRREEEGIPIHALSAHHKAQVEKLTLNCENWKVDMNYDYVEVIFPTLSDADHNMLVDILKQNKLIVLDRSYRVFCGLCSQHFYVNKLREIYDHIARTGHFSAFVQSLNLNWETFGQKYVNGIIKSTGDDTISYCLVCNFILPSASAAAHRTSSVHEYLLPIFIRNAFSDHGLKHTDDRVVCTMCERKLSDKSLNMFNIYDHIKGSLHVYNSIQNLRKVCDQIDLLGQGGVHRFPQIDISYCGTCNILFNGVSDESVFGHLDSQVHHIFEYVGPEQL